MRLEISVLIKWKHLLVVMERPHELSSHWAFVLVRHGFPRLAGHVCVSTWMKCDLMNIEIDNPMKLVMISLYYIFDFVSHSLNTA